MHHMSHYLTADPVLHHTAYPILIILKTLPFLVQTTLKNLTPYIQRHSILPSSSHSPFKPNVNPMYNPIKAALKGL